MRFAAPRVLRLCYCVVRACEEWKKTIQIPCSANYVICRAACVTTLLLCGVCVCGTEKKTTQIPCSANYAICRAACVTTLLLCGACVRVWNGKKNYSNPLLSKLRDFPRRVVCLGVFVIRTCVRCPNTKILRESVRCPVCSLSELFVNLSPTVYLCI